MTGPVHVYCVMTCACGMVFQCDNTMKVWVLTVDN